MTEMEMFMFCEWSTYSIVVYHPSGISGKSKPIARYAPSYVDDNTHVVHLLYVGNNKYFLWKLDAVDPVEDKMEEDSENINKQGEEKEEDSFSDEEDAVTKKGFFFSGLSFLLSG
jgi:hypothetical protein